MRNISNLHQSVVDRMIDVADAMDELFEAVDAAAAAAENDPKRRDPKRRDYLNALKSLMSFTLPPLPPSPTP